MPEKFAPALPPEVQLVVDIYVEKAKVVAREEGYQEALKRFQSAVRAFYNDEITSDGVLAILESMAEAARKGSGK